MGLAGCAESGAPASSDDGAADTLEGDAGTNWFFAHVQGAGVLDTILHLGKEELVTEV